MKSLELINERIEDLESRLESANYLANGNPSEFGKTVIGDLSKHLDSCKQIKQDLEVLEIIGKNLKFKEASYTDVTPHNTISMNMIEIIGQTNEEFNKVKQWLEVNE